MLGWNFKSKDKFYFRFSTIYFWESIFSSQLSQTLETSDELGETTGPRWPKCAGLIFQSLLGHWNVWRPRTNTLYRLAWGKVVRARCKLHDYESMVMLKSIPWQLMLPASDPGARFASQIPRGSSLGELRASSCVLCPLCSWESALHLDWIAELTDKPLR